MANSNPYGTMSPPPPYLETPTSTEPPHLSLDANIDLLSNPGAFLPPSSEFDYSTHSEERPPPYTRLGPDPPRYQRYSREARLVLNCALSVSFLLTTIWMIVVLSLPSPDDASVLQYLCAGYHLMLYGVWVRTNGCQAHLTSFALKALVTLLVGPAAAGHMEADDLRDSVVVGWMVLDLMVAVGTLLEDTGVTFCRADHEEDEEDDEVDVCFFAATGIVRNDNLV